MGSLNTIIVRLMLDSRLCISSLHSDRLVRGMLAGNNVEDVALFFADQVIGDVKILGQCLQYSLDEPMLLIRYLLGKVRLAGKKIKANEDEEMSSKEASNEY